MDDIREKLGVVTATATAAHGRLDKLEGVIRDDLKQVNDQLRELNAHMNKGKGWTAAMIFLAGAGGAGAIKLLSMFGPQ